MDRILNLKKQQKLNTGYQIMDIMCTAQNFKSLVFLKIYFFKVIVFFIS